MRLHVIDYMYCGHYYYSILYIFIVMGLLQIPRSTIVISALLALQNSFLVQKSKYHGLRLVNSFYSVRTCNCRYWCC